jgi:hypothetical protein
LEIDEGTYFERRVLIEALKRRREDLSLKTGLGRLEKV